MDKIRHLSDLHVDINSAYPLEIKDKDVFTVVTGDIAGETEEGIEWIRRNVKRGIVLSGNHMPYRNTYDRGRENWKTIDEFRQWLKAEFPMDSDVTYLDASAGCCSKVVDGILFLGSCFYSNFKVKDPIWNPGGDEKVNMACSKYNMNDYRFGYTGRRPNAAGEPGLVPMQPEDLKRWFQEAYDACEKELSANEAKENPLPVVLATHYPLVLDYVGHNYYLDSPSYIRSQREFNVASYASDMKVWLKRHPSIKAYMSGHIHAVEKDYRYYKTAREGMDNILMVHNARGYVSRGHARWFNPDTFVDVATWTCSETPVSEEEDRERRRMCDDYVRSCLAWGM